MPSYTVNELMIYMSIARSRLKELESIQSRICTKDTFIYEDRERTTEPQYDPKKVDAKMSEINKFLLKADMAIKNSNAKTVVGEIDYDANELLEPLD